MVASIYTDFYASRLKLMNEATDPALKAHFQAELDQVTLMSGGATGSLGAETEEGDILDAGEAPSTAPGLNLQSNVSTRTASSRFGAAGQDNDSNKKVQTLQPLAEKIGKQTGVPPNILLAIMVQESRGYGINAMQGLNGLMQLGPDEFKHLQGKYPQYLQGMSHLSTEGQMMSAALYLKDLKGNSSWDDAIFKYNHGPNAGDNPQLGDPGYMNSIHETLDAIARGGKLSS